MELLWSGTDPGFAGSLTDALDRANVRHGDESVELGFLRAFPGAVYKVSVRAADEEDAQKILQDVIDGMAAKTPTTTPSDLARAATTLNPYKGLSLNARVFSRVPDEQASDEDGELPDSESADVPTPDDEAEDFDPGQATCEVWAGEDAKMAAYLNDCLRGVGIGCVVSAGGPKVRVLVQHATEKRAREIIREIVEASPPE
jgi:hypothetical protein